MQEWFEEWFDSPYYHILYSDRNEAEAFVFVQNIMNHFQLNAENTLLDIACGKGRHAVAFAANGMDVTGIDLSVNSIHEASKQAHDRLNFFVHDMRNVFRTNYFDMVCNLFTSFGYFKSSHDNLLAAKAMYNAVRKNGHVLIDYVNRNYAIQNIERRTEEQLIIENIEFRINRSFTDQKFMKSIVINDAGREFHFEECINSFTLSEITSIFNAVGLNTVEVWGDYQLGKYDEANSSRMILVLSK